MKLATCILPLLLLAAAALARPAEPEAVTNEDAAQVAEPQAPSLPEDALPDAQSALVRERRWVQDKHRGSVWAGVHREKDVGTVVQAQGQGNIWTSKDGKTKLDVHGGWTKVFDGPGRGKPNYNAGINFTSRF